MVALPASERFFAPEISKVYLIPAVASETAVTRAEITAGTDLTGEIADVSGWSVTGQMINTPDWGSRFISQISGRTSAENSSITFYADKAGVDIRTVLSRGDRTHILFCDGGDVTSYKADLFAVEVTSVGKVRTGSDGALQITISFAITRVPTEDLTLPATA